VFVPVIPPTPSPEAENLGREIAELVRRYYASHPEIRAEDVHQAFVFFNDTATTEIYTVGPRFALILAGLLGFAVLGGILLLVSQGATPPRTLTLVAVVGAITVAVAVIFLRRQR
jgi:hypothetical protein